MPNYWDYWKSRPATSRTPNAYSNTGPCDLRGGTQPPCPDSSRTTGYRPIRWRIGNRSALYTNIRSSGRPPSPCSPPVPRKICYGRVPPAANRLASEPWGLSFAATSGITAIFCVTDIWTARLSLLRIAGRLPGTRRIHFRIGRPFRPPLRDPDRRSGPGCVPVPVLF